MKTIKNVVCEVMAFSGEDGGYYFPVASFTSLAEAREWVADHKHEYYDLYIDEL